MRVSQASLAAALAVLPTVLAQTSTACNPTEKTCPDDTGLNSATYTADFTKGESALSSWSPAIGTTLSYSDQGALFSITKQGVSPTIGSDFYIFFGRVEVTAKLAPGTGIVSSFVLQSDDLDEIDWEFLGADSGYIQTNFFGKGNTTSYDRMVKAQVSDAESSYHTYTLDWTSERLQWIIDGSVVRELPYSDALTLSGKNYPQTPMQIKLGNWAAGGEGQPEGVVTWAGGKTDFSKAPFNMYVKSVSVTNYNPADKYSYGDKTGSYQSIKKLGGSSSGSNSSSSSSNSTSSASGNSTQTATTNTVAPMSSASVVAIDQNTAAAGSVTATASSYSMNTQSASALNAGNGTMTTAVSASTQVPGSQPTATGGSGSSTASSSSSPASQTNASGASSLRVVTVGSLLSAALGFWML